MPGDKINSANGRVPGWFFVALSISLVLVVTASVLLAAGADVAGLGLGAVYAVSVILVRGYIRSHPEQWRGSGEAARGPD
jgi:hypothetical protein